VSAGCLSAKVDELTMRLRANPDVHPALPVLHQSARTYLQPSTIDLAKLNHEKMIGFLDQ